MAGTWICCSVTPIISHIWHTSVCSHVVQYGVCSLACLTQRLIMASSDLLHTHLALAGMRFNYHYYRYLKTCRVQASLYGLHGKGEHLGCYQLPTDGWESRQGWNRHSGRGNSSGKQQRIGQAADATHAGSLHHNPFSTVIMTNRIQLTLTQIVRVCWCILLTAIT